MSPPTRQYALEYSNLRATSSMSSVLPCALSFYIALKQGGLYRIVQYRPRIDTKSFTNNLASYMPITAYSGHSRFSSHTSAKSTKGNGNHIPCIISRISSCDSARLYMRNSSISPVKGLPSSVHVVGLCCNITDDNAVMAFAGLVCDNVTNFVKGIVYNQRRIRFDCRSITGKVQKLTLRQSPVI